MTTVRRVVSCADDGAENVVAEFELVDGRVLARYPRDVIGLARQLFEDDALGRLREPLRQALGATR